MMFASLSQTLKKPYIKVLETFRQYYNKLTVPSEEKGAIARLDVTKNRINGFLGIIGYDMLREDFKLTSWSYFVTFDCLCFIIISGYDISLFWGDLLRICFCACTWSYGFQGVSRFNIGIAKPKRVFKLNQIQNHFTQEMEREVQMTDTVRKFARYIDVQTKATSILFCVTGILTAIYPGFVYAYTKEKLLPIGVVVPGLSDVEQTGYALNYCFQITNIVFAVSGMTGVQNLIIMFLIGICLMIEVLIIKIKQLGMQIHAKEVNKDTDRNVDMTEIIKLHQNILEYGNFKISFV